MLSKHVSKALALVGGRQRTTNVPRLCHACATNTPQNVPRTCHACATQKSPRKCYVLRKKQNVPRMCHACATYVPRMCHACATHVLRCVPCTSGDVKGEPGGPTGPSSSLAAVRLTSAVPTAKYLLRRNEAQIGRTYKSNVSFYKCKATELDKRIKLYYNDFKSDTQRCK